MISVVRCGNANLRFCLFVCSIFFIFYKVPVLICCETVILLRTGVILRFYLIFCGYYELSISVFHHHCHSDLQL